jgi:hypothetical protein
MCALVLLHGCLIVTDNFLPILQDYSYFAPTMIVILLAVVVSLLIGYFVLTRRWWAILGVSVLCAYGLAHDFGQFMDLLYPLQYLKALNYIPPINLLVGAIYVVEAIIPLFGMVILFMGFKASLRASRA